MTKTEAKKLKNGYRVRECAGVVIDIGPNAIRFLWDDGLVLVMTINPLSELEFINAVTSVADELARGEISRTLAASDLRRFLAGRAMQKRLVSETKERNHYTWDT